MNGELNGTNVLLYRGNPVRSELVGQLDINNSFGGDAILISNKSYGDYVVLLSESLASQQWNLSGSIMYNSDATYEESKSQRLSGTQARYYLDYGDDKTLTFMGMFDTMTDTYNQGVAGSTAFSIVTTGQPQQVFELVSSDGFALVSSDGYTLTAGAPLGN